ncbi:hypothetical protein LSH36_294g03033 [Paralvinella palmiformis]|uniref:Uncharacterized protein n=1 Tax=Paralvinella palmiformis TaxID=53620 RepID=A0AAD9JIA0_9ANNE|nr:hypothetical protein LSH36_294g03033 [Paralvinella palmiformis]
MYLDAVFVGVVLEPLFDLVDEVVPGSPATLKHDRTIDDDVEPFVQHPVSVVAFVSHTVHDDGKRRSLIDQEPGCGDPVVDGTMSPDGDVVLERPTLDWVGLVDVDGQEVGERAIVGRHSAEGGELAHKRGSGTAAEVHDQGPARSLVVQQLRPAAVQSDDAGVVGLAAGEDLLAEFEQEEAQVGLEALPRRDRRDPVVLGHTGLVHVGLLLDLVHQPLGDARDRERQTEKELLDDQPHEEERQP